LRLNKYKENKTAIPNYKQNPSHAGYFLLTFFHYYKKTKLITIIGFRNSIGRWSHRNCTHFQFLWSVFRM